MERKGKRIKQNLISSLVYQVVLISLSFLLPRLYLENFGSEVNGVLSSIKQIFLYLILLEAGVGLATTQALYKRIGERDYKSANEVLAATRVYYNKTGFLCLAIVLIIAVVYAYVIPTSINPHIVFALVMLTGLPMLFSYFVQAKYRILMEVDGRRYVLNNADTILQIVANAGKILVLLLTDSLILIQLVYCILYLIQLAAITCYAKRRYKWLDLSVKPDFAAIGQKNSVLVHQLSGMVFNNTDVILISAMCDFKAASVYTIYNIFFAQVQTFIASVVSSFTFALGQMFHTNRARFDKFYHAYETVYVMATSLVFTLMAVFLLPIIQIYTTGINDAQYTNTVLLLLFVLASLLSGVKVPANSVIEFAGAFAKTRTFAIWEMALNLTTSILGIYFFGICGALLGTIAALLYRCVVSIRYANREILNRKFRETAKILLANGACFLLVMAVFFVDTFSGVSFIKLILCGVLHSLWIVPLFLLANFLINRDAFTLMLELYREKKQ